MTSQQQQRGGRMAARRKWLGMRRVIRRNSLAEWASALVSGGAILWGLLLLRTPDSFEGASFRFTFSLASPTMWGWLMILIGGFFGWIVLTERRSAWLAAIPLLGLYTAWGATLVRAGGLPPLASVGLAVLAAFLCAVYYDEAHPRPERATTAASGRTS